MRFVMYSALVGLCAPLLILFIARFLWDIFVWSHVVATLWPSSIQLMALDTVNEPGLGVMIFVFAFSIGINVILYALLGAIVRGFVSIVAWLVK